MFDFVYCRNSVFSSSIPNLGVQQMVRPGVGASGYTAVRTFNRPLHEYASRPSPQAGAGQMRYAMVQRGTPTLGQQQMVRFSRKK